MALMPWKTTEPMTEKEQFITLEETKGVKRLN
jgi:hypothetical protein